MRDGVCGEQTMLTITLFSKTVALELVSFLNVVY